MIHRNISRERCLVCCPRELFAPEHAALLLSLGYEVKIINDKSEALRSFITVKPSLFLIHHTFLPVFPHRLIQLFKMAHRTPTVLLMAEKITQVWGYLHLKNEGDFEFIETPLRSEEVALGVKHASQRLKATRRKLFYKDLLTHVGLALPVIGLLVYLLF
ncbi:MAG: hypothetical protein LBI42_14625 [Chitinispirillales bacterium]|jgi:FixJ family two-component response regulator|nr:hypothetical protein [Chitinispirillales bacterium]